MGESTAGSVATAAIVVTCNRRSLLEANLGTLLEQTRPFARVLVVDNASTDGTREWLESVGSVEVVALEENLGFAAALNRGIEIALGSTAPRTARPEADWIAAINNDVRLDPDWHHRALEVVESGAALGVGSNHMSVGPARPIGSVATLLLQENDPQLIDSAGIEWHESGRALNRLHGRDVGQLTPSTLAGEVWGASAAAALFSRELLESVGGFDESFFAYQEDVDLALRARLAGFDSRLAHRAVGWHLGHGTNRDFVMGGTRADYLNSRNRLAVVASARLEGQALMPVLRWVAGDLLRSFREHRAAAVWLGTAHGLVRWPRSMALRRPLHRRLKKRRLKELDEPLPCGKDP